uniref:Uncharacterized protein n=2 Tax=Mucochytrium quahogii TaxID=96639 RepID=A0A7S2RMY5_9STRA|mmetsp:Transcript_8780/g.16374  ORF Transcript_8780/g.16374 Transcript_8780/m.16374 type:complete len:131 (-) Transcript_8780:61-453(-)
MNLLEGKGECYIQDRGVSRWDTCAAQAIIEAKGGVLVKLTDFLKDKSLNSYSYKKSVLNCDVDSAKYPPRLTKYNTRQEPINSDPQIVGKLKPYANVCGLLALDALGVAKLDMYYDICTSSANTKPPVFD